MAAAGRRARVAPVTALALAAILALPAGAVGLRAPSALAGALVPGPVGSSHAPPTATAGVPAPSPHRTESLSSVPGSVPDEGLAAGAVGPVGFAVAGPRVTNGSVPGSPTITAVRPAAGSANVSWSAPSTGAPPDGYRVEWGVESNFSSNVTVGAGVLSAEITPLTAFARYSLTVVAFNANGSGPPSPFVNLTLTAWTRVGGTVTPATAHVNLDGMPVPVSGSGAFSVNTTLAPHALSAIAPDHATGTAIVLPIWNGTVTVSLVLALLNGTVRGTISPAVATVAWDGVPLSVAGDGSYGVSATPGIPHLLAASYPGFTGVARNVTVAANRTAWVNLTLSLLPGALQLSILPINATVTVANAAVPLDPSGNATLVLPPGRVAWSVAAPGFVARSGNATIPSNATAYLVVSLNRTPSATHPTSSAPPWWAGATPEEILIAALFVALVVVGLLAWRRRGPGPEVQETERFTAEPFSTEPPPGVLPEEELPPLPPGGEPSEPASPPRGP